MTIRISVVLLASALALAGCGGKDKAPEPYAAKYGETTNPQAAPDNSQINQRDRADDMPGPMDQGTSDQDIAITRSIRQALVANKSLSIDAQNIKIITLELAVALRGPVANESEKKQIEEIAQATAGVVKVFNMLDVELATN